MSTKEILHRVKPLGEKLKKFRYPALILILGIALMLIPFQKQKQAQSLPQTVEARLPEPDYKTQTEQQLRQILVQMAGVGRVSVMLTLRTGTETIYQTDSTLSAQTGATPSNTASETTVLIQKSGAGQEAVIRKTIFPGFLGALIVCEGADNPTVKLNVINAVAGITGLSSEKITVVKMK